MIDIPKAPNPYRLRLVPGGAGRPGFELAVAGFKAVLSRIINALLACVAAFVAWIVGTQFSPGFHEDLLWTAIHWGAFSLLMCLPLLATFAGLKGLLARKTLLLHPDLSGFESVFRLGGVTISRRTWSLGDFDHVRFRFVYGGYKSGTGHEVSLVGPGQLLEFTSSRSRAESISFALGLGKLTGLPVKGIPEEPFNRPALKPVPIIRTFEELKAGGICEDQS